MLQLVWVKLTKNLRLLQHFLEQVLWRKAKHPRETCQHLPLIPEAGSKNVSQSHDSEPQSICSENTALCKPRQESAAKGSVCSPSPIVTPNSTTPFLTPRQNATVLSAHCSPTAGTIPSHLVSNKNTVTFLWKVFYLWASSLPPEKLTFLQFC